MSCEVAAVKPATHGQTVTAVTMLAVIFVGRQCRPSEVAHVGNWQVQNFRPKSMALQSFFVWRPTMLARVSREPTMSDDKLDFIEFYLFVTFCRFLSKAVAFCREISYIYRWTSCYPTAIYWSNMIDFACVNFSLISMSIIAARAVSLLKLCVFSSFLYSAKIRCNDKYFCFSKFFADSCRMSADNVGHQCRPTLTAHVSRAWYGKMHQNSKSGGQDPRLGVPL